jgi:1,4-alpha-glucan branching enzyme
MGGELAQETEWNHDATLPWHLLDSADHRGVQRLVRDLNRLYIEKPALHEADADASGFEWIVGDDADNSVFAWLRRGGGDTVLVVANLTPEPRYAYRIGVIAAGEWRELLNTDASVYGGSGVGNGGHVAAEPVGTHGRAHSLSLILPPLGVLVLAPVQSPGRTHAD